MKSTGIVRKVDELGRIVLPIELRRTLNIEEKDALEIYVDENSIMLKKYDKMNLAIQEMLIAVRVVKAFVRGTYEEEKFNIRTKYTIEKKSEKKAM